MAAPGTVPRVLLDRYELRELAGAGGMGEVWMGWDHRLGRDVAVKLLLPQLSDEPAFRQRFEVEARAAAALAHPNVVQVFDIDEDDGALFIVMERLPGPSLDRRLAEGPLSEEDVKRLAVDMLSGLGAAHAENLVHRDIKPGNLIRSAGDRWKIGDFGVAKDLASTAHLTMVGVAVGTPAYLAPEQLDGRPATSATDLWAAAVVLRECLTGQRPFEGDDPVAVAHAVKHTSLTPLGQLLPDVDPALTRTIDRGLSSDPVLRFTSVDRMLAALEGKDPTPAPVAMVIPALPPAAAPVAPVAGAPAPGQGSPAPVSATPEPAGRGTTAQRAGFVALVVGVVVILFLLGLLFGLTMADETDRGEPVDIESEMTDQSGRPSEQGDEPSSEPTNPSDSSVATDSPSTTTTQAPPSTNRVPPSNTPGSGAGDGNESSGAAGAEGKSDQPDAGSSQRSQSPRVDADG